MPRLPDQDFRKRDTFVFGLVRQHWPGNDVTDCPDSGHSGRIVMIDDDAAALVQFGADFLEAKPFGVRLAPNRHEHNVSLDGFGSAAFGGLDGRPQLCARTVYRSDFRRQLERHALLFEQALRLAAHLAVHSGQNAVEEFDNGYFRAKPPPYGPELEIG